MAKKGKYTFPGTPECTSFSLEKKSLPGGGPDINKNSASKKLGSVGGSPSSPDGYSLADALKR